MSTVIQPQAPQANSRPVTTVSIYTLSETSSFCPLTVSASRQAREELLGQ